MILTTAFSPCPNDTFIFDALVNNKIDTEGLIFEPVLEDIETLNKEAIEERFDITKLSFPAYFKNLEKYLLLDSGAALGKGTGPILISKSPVKEDSIEKLTVALPGRNTTANLLFSSAYPHAKQKRFMVFSAIEDAVLNSETDLGVIIHENRFTYQQKGLLKQTDLGEYWEERLKLPVPLGGIAVRRRFEKELIGKINRLLKKSIDHAFANYPLITPYVKANSQTMSEEVMRQHIQLYVNDFSLDIGETGKKAVLALYEIFLKANEGEDKKNHALFL